MTKRKNFLVIHCLWGLTVSPFYPGSALANEIGAAKPSYRAELAKKDYALGPTGLRGWMLSKAEPLTSQDMWTSYTTRHAREIIITQVDKNSPADGLLKVGDVVIGIAGKPFAEDPRKAIASAINEAEIPANKGLLKLNLKAQQKSKKSSREVILTLRTLAKYSDTAPFNCPKSELIKQQTIESLLKENLNGKIGLPLLALMATNDEEAREKVYPRIQGIGKGVYDTEDAKIGPQNTWRYSYKSIILGEYYSLTKDRSVLPALQSLNEVIAKGQSSTGDWGHKMADYAFNGNRLHGRLQGYASLNHPSLTCLYALVLGSQLGIESPEIKRAINLSTKNFTFYINKGSIGYGYGRPNDQLFTNNGMSGIAAHIFDLQNNETATRFFSHLGSASSHMIETGHTGPFFNQFWTALGVSLAGPELTSQYLQKWRWLQTLCRKWDGGFIYQKPGGGRLTYRGLSASAAHLLYLCIPEQNLHITGKKKKFSDHPSREQAAEITGLPQQDFTTKTLKDLYDYLGHELPPIRIRAAMELVTRNNLQLEKILSMLSGNYHQKIGACYVIRLLKSEAHSAIEPLVELVIDANETSWIRESACKALASIGDAVEPYSTELAKTFITLPQEDRRQSLKTSMGALIARCYLKSKSPSLSQELRFKIASELMNHPHHLGRYYGVSLIHKISIQQFHLVAEPLLKIIENRSEYFMSYTQDYGRAAALGVLERLNIKEGIDLAISTIEPNLWGQKYRFPARIKILGKYGANAKPYIPEIEKQLGDSAKDLIESIKSSEDTRELISLKDAIQVGKVSAKK